MSIETYGTGKRMELVARLIGFCESEHIVILPVPTTKDKKYITNTDVTLEETLVNVGIGSKIVGYGLPDEYKEKAGKLGALVYDAELDEEFLAENAYITAIGAIGYILSNTDKVPKELAIGVFGYGRIGKRLVQMLLFLGAKVVVYTSKILTRLDLGSYGVESASVVETGGEYDFSELDILINTAPRDMTAFFEDGKKPFKTRVIELASGDNFKGIEGVERLPALPERMYPDSAARAYIKAIKRFV